MSAKKSNPSGEAPASQAGASLAPQKVPSFDSMGPEEPEFASEYSKDYWDLVIEQLGKRWLFKVGLAVLTLLYGAAIFAPMLANNRPYYIDSVDTAAYSSAVRPLRAMVNTAGTTAALTDDEFAAELAKTRDLPDGAARSRMEKVRVERDAAGLRVATMKGMLSAEDAAPLDEYLALFDKAIAAAEAGPSDEVAQAFDETKSLARTFRRGMKPLDPANPEGGGLSLVSQRQYPLFDSIAPWEAGLMAFWILWALWPIWNWIVNRLLLFGNRNRIRAARTFKILGVLGLCLAAAAMWSARYGSVAEFDVSTYKSGLTQGTTVLLEPGRTTAELAAATTDEQRDALAGDILWAPITMGFAELHEPEKYRPPTWRKDSEMDPETGRYVHRKAVLDPSTGQLPPANPPEIRVSEPEVNAASRHWLGTDESGRDLASRMLWGSRTSLSVGILSALLLTIIGVIIGSIAGFFGGRIDDMIMRGIEILQSIPAFFLILLALAFTDPNTVPPMFAIVIVIAVVRWTGIARLVRGEFLRLREQEFVVAAQALGFGPARTIFRHVLPNAMSPVLVAAAFSVAAGILTESAVSYLGFGISEPSASWGSIVNESKSAEHWWIQIFPGIAIFVTVTCYNLVGDAIRDAMDPKMKV